ncbi:hypothetical protein GGH96_006315 [Coemansia sp. RSA 1972]|nr:hypothetical protein GGH96_006315 [Coemansia sp. RSA 1972]
MFAFILILFFVLLASEQAQVAARIILVAIAEIAGLNIKATPTAPAKVAAELQQRLDAQAEMCLELHRRLAEQTTKDAVMLESHTTLQRFYAHNSGLVEEYARALVAKERRLEEADDKLLAAIDDRDAKIEVIASLKYNEGAIQGRDQRPPGRAWLACRVA